MEILGGLGHAVDTPAAYLRGLLAGRPGERVSGAELLGGGAGEGLAAEVLLDPLNLLAGGVGIPLAALSKLDKTADVARAAGMTAKELEVFNALRAAEGLSHNQAVDWLLNSGVMPERLAKETALRTTEMVPKGGVTADQLVSAFEQIDPSASRYREMLRSAMDPTEGSNLIHPEDADRIMTDLITAHVQEPAGPWLTEKGADRFEARQAVKRTGMEGKTEEIIKELLDQADAHGYGSGTLRPERESEIFKSMLGRGYGFEPARLHPESGALMELFEEVSRPAAMGHITSAPEGQLSDFNELLTSVKRGEDAVQATGPTVGEVTGVGDTYGGEGVYSYPARSHSAWDYMEEAPEWAMWSSGYDLPRGELPPPPYLSGRTLEGAIHSENPLVIPEHSLKGHTATDYYTEGGLQQFILDNPDMFPVENMNEVQRRMVEASRGTGFDALDPGADLLSDPLNIDSALKYDDEFGELVEQADESFAGLPGDAQQAVEEFVAVSGKNLDELKSQWAASSLEGKLSQQGQGFDSFLAEQIAEHGDESHQLVDFDIDSADIGAAGGDELSEFLTELSGGADEFRSRPDVASEIIRQEGYDSLVFARGADWITQLFSEKHYNDFRSIILGDPKFWTEVNMMYPETAKAFEESMSQLPGRATERFGQPTKRVRGGYQQAFNVFRDPDTDIMLSVVPGKISEVPDIETQKKVLGLIGLVGMNEVLKSVERKRREVAL